MNATIQQTFPITGMTCANCVATIERKLKKLDGLQMAVVNLSSERATVEYDPGQLMLADIITRVERSGYGVAMGQADLLIEHLRDANDAARLEKALSKINGVVKVSMALMLALAAPVQFYVGWHYYLGALKALRNGSTNIDVLIAIGSSVALFYSLPVTFGWLDGHVYFNTAAVIITLIRLGKFLEARAKGQISAAIKKLMGLRAKTAHIIRGGQKYEVAVDDVQVGDLLLVRPGETIPVDGVTGRFRGLEQYITNRKKKAATEGDPCSFCPGRRVCGSSTNGSVFTSCRTIKL